MKQRRYASNARNRDRDIRAKMMRKPVGPVGDPVDWARLHQQNVWDGACRSCGHHLCSCEPSHGPMFIRWDQVAEQRISDLTTLTARTGVDYGYTVPATATVVVHYNPNTGKIVCLSANGAMLKPNEPASQTLWSTLKGSMPSPETIEAFEQLRKQVQAPAAPLDLLTRHGSTEAVRQAAAQALAAEPTFKVGDRVRYTKHYRDGGFNQEGTVVRVTDRRVEWNSGTSFRSTPVPCLEHAPAAPSEIPGHWKRTGPREHKRSSFDGRSIHGSDDGWRASDIENVVFVTALEAMRAVDERWPIEEALPPGWVDFGSAALGRGKAFKHTSGVYVERRADKDRWNWFTLLEDPCIEFCATRDHAMARALGWECGRDGFWRKPGFDCAVQEYRHFKRHGFLVYGHNNESLAREFPTLPHAIAAVLEAEKR